MSKRLLTFGIISLFILSTLAPMSMGYNIKSTSIDIPMKVSSVPTLENPPNLIWHKTFGGISHDTGQFIQQTSDSGYIICGVTKSYGVGDWDVWLIKTDIDGNEIWNKTYGGPYEDIGYCVRETSDSGFIIIGYYGNSINGPYDVWLIKTDEDGNLQWDRKYNAPLPNAYGKCVIELDDGYLGLAIIHDASLDFNIWLLKTDFNGKELWNKTVGEVDDRCNSVIQTNGGDFVFTGRASDNFGNEKVVLIKTDENGNMIWRRTYWGVEGYGIIKLNDNGYIIAAGRASGKAHLIRTDENGVELWRKTYYKHEDYNVRSFAQTSDGGYVIAGHTHENNGDMFLIKTDENGNKMWISIIGGKSYDSARCVIESNDGNYIIAGTTESYSIGGWDVWLIKIAPFENIRPNIPRTPIGPESGRVFVEHNFSTSSSDPDGELVYFTWSWGDGYIDSMEGPYYNNDLCTILYGWVFIGNFEVMVKAIDVYGGESDWSEPLKIRITIPRTRASYDTLFSRFIDMFPIIQKILGFLSIK